MAAGLGKRRLPTYTEYTIGSRRKLLAELAAVRGNGFAVNEEETIRGAVAVALPVFDSTGRAFAAVSITVPTTRCSRPGRGAMVAEIKRAAGLISRDLDRLGYVAAFRVGVSRKRFEA